MMRARFILVQLISAMILLTGSTQLMAITPDEAVASMSGLGAGAAASIQNEDPSGTVPKYSTKNANEALYGTGDALPTGPGSAKITNCSTAVASTDLYARQECESINFVSKNRTLRPDITLSTRDPVIAGNRTITNDPRDTLEKYKWLVPVNSDGSIGNMPGGTCTATTISTPAQYEERTCTFYKGGENFLCKAPLVVNVIPHFNYQCQDTSGTNSTSSCTKLWHVACNNYCPAPNISFAWSVNPARPSWIPETPVTFSTQNVSLGLWRTTVTTPDVSLPGGVTLGERPFTITIDSVAAFEYMKVISSSKSLSAKSMGTPYSFFIFSPRFPGFPGCSSCTFSPGIQIGADFHQMLSGGANAMRLGDGSTGATGITFVIEYKQASGMCNQNCSESLENNCTSLEQRSLP